MSTFRGFSQSIWCILMQCNARSLDVASASASHGIRNNGVDGDACRGLRGEVVVSRPSLHARVKVSLDEHSLNRVRPLILPHLLACKCAVDAL